MIHGRNYTVDFPDENGIRVAFIDILLDDCYQLGRIKTPVKTIIDIGANVGLFDLAARRRFPEAIIHAYEPNPNLEIYLKQQVSAGKFEYFMEAVGLESGKGALDYHEDSVQTRWIHDQNGNIAQTAFRETINRLGGSVDLIKMDCEGAEWEIFQDEKSWSRVQHLSMEYHLKFGRTAKEALNKVRELGFHIIRHSPASGFGIIIASRE